MFQKTVSFIQKQEKYLFILVLLINIWFVLYSKYYPSMDGAAHLHNAYLFRQLFNGSEFLENYFVINTIPIPNWTNHMVLASLLSIAPPNIAEKGTYVIYIILTSLSFRYLIKQLQPENIIASFLIFPFLFSFLLHLGFLNFCYSIGFMFLGLGYYLKYQYQLRMINGATLAAILLLTYFSNVLGFVYLLFFIFLFCFVNNFRGTISLDKNNLGILAKKYIVLLLIGIVPIVCLLIFYKSIVFFPSTFEYKRYELIDWIFDLRPLVVYISSEDKEYTQVLFFLLMAAFFISAFNFFSKEQKFKWSISIILLGTLFFTMVLLFKIPDGSSAGMMSDRLCLMMFIVFLIALVSFPIPKSILYVLVAGTIFINFSMFHYNHKRIIKNYSVHADKIYNISSHINSKSIVLPISIETDWLEGHFSNYLGVDKELVILENYQANVGWFPLKWNKEKLPKFVIGNKQNIGNIYWMTNPDSKIEKKIDYVFLYGNTSKLDQPEYAELKADLLDNYILDESITDSYTKLFKLK